MLPVQRRIDFMAGTHGNYLELIVNKFIDRNPIDVSRSLFDQHGGCHQKNAWPDYQPITRALHYTQGRSGLNRDDLVIRIVCQKQDMLIALANAYLRAGSESLDLDLIEYDTLRKIQALKHRQRTLALDLVQQYGVRGNYPRRALRNLFFAMFNEAQHGIDLFVKFDPRPTYRYHDFPFRAFFDIKEFSAQLNELAKFVDLKFYPDPDLDRIHREFLLRNQGWQYQQACDKILENAFANESVTIKLNVMQEAWINYQIARMFDIHGLPELWQEAYPENTQILTALFYETRHRQQSTAN